MPLSPEEIPPVGLKISDRTARRWRNAGCDFSTAATTLEWVLKVTRSGELNIQRRHIDQLQLICIGAPKSVVEEPSLGVGGDVAVAAEPLRPKSEDLGAALEMDVDQVLGLHRKRVSLAAKALGDALDGGTEIERSQAGRDFEAASEAMRKFEKDAVGIQKGRGALWDAATVKRSIHAGFGKVRMGLDGLIARHPELEPEIRTICDQVKSDPLMKECLAS